MDKRSNEGPMDFEYQNGTGPIDARSPFAQISLNQQRAGNSAQPSTKKRGISNALQLSFEILIAWSGLFAAFASPSKSSIPSLREPNSHPHLFSQPPTPYSAAKHALFNTPRRFEPDPASSGGETPQSPEHNPQDSDATPDNSTSINFHSPAKLANASIPVFTAGQQTNTNENNNPSPTKKSSRRDSWFHRSIDYLYSPGNSSKSQAPRGPYSDKLEKRIKKKRLRDAYRQMARARDDSASDSETNDEPPLPPPRTSPRKISRTKRGDLAVVDDSPAQQQQNVAGSISSFFEFLATHPTLPTILSWYAQLALNVFLFTGVMFILWSFWSTIRSDVDKKSSEAIAELLSEMGQCATQYNENKCARETRVPAMEVVCSNWEKCMNRDTSAVGRARVSAHTFAEIFNSFLEPISYKAMVCVGFDCIEWTLIMIQAFTMALIFGCAAMSNLPFTLFRHRAAEAAAAQQNHHHYYGPPPPTPHRQISAGHEGMQTWTPMIDRQGIEPPPSAQYGTIDGRGSPVKTLNFR